MIICIVYQNVNKMETNGVHFGTSLYLKWPFIFITAGFVAGWPISKKCFEHQAGFVGNSPGKYEPVLYETHDSMVKALTSGEVKHNQHTIKLDSTMVYNIFLFSISLFESDILCEYFRSTPSWPLTVTKTHLLESNTVTHPSAAPKQVTTI